MVEQKTIKTIEDKLSVPAVVQDILASGANITCDTRYALHEVISDFQPDSALLCIALSAQAAIASQGCQNTGLQLLQIETERMIEDYAPLWLNHIENEEICPSLLFETLSALPEDLEDLAELILLASDFLIETDPKAAEILDILYTQANAHAIIAEQYVDVMEEIEEESAVLPFTQAPAAFNDNVIPFPGTEVQS